MKAIYQRGPAAAIFNFSFNGFLRWLATPTRDLQVLSQNWTEFFAFTGTCSKLQQVFSLSEWCFRVIVEFVTPKGCCCPNICTNNFVHLFVEICPKNSWCSASYNACPLQNILKRISATQTDLDMCLNVFCNAIRRHCYSNDWQNKISKETENILTSFSEQVFHTQQGRLYIKSLSVQSYWGIL